MTELHRNATYFEKSATCPSCGRSNDAATQIDNQDVRPRPGDIAVCWGCAAFCKYTDTMGLELLTIDEIAELDADLVMELNRARRDIQRGLL